MSSSHGNDLHGDGMDEHLTPEEFAAIAAVDGIGALSDEEAASVDRAEVAELEAAAGALFAAFALENSGLQQPPQGVLDRLQGILEHHMPSSNRGPQSAVPAQFPGTAASPRPVAPSSTAESRGWTFGSVAAIAGWAAAAALLAGLLTTLQRVSDLEGGNVQVDAAVALTQFQLSTPDVRQLAWQPLGENAPVRGAVIWSDEANDGFMRIQGLAVNDPSKSQYQLWIFRGSDPGAEPHPVDGGVFNVASEGEVIVPIDAKLNVGGAALFAVTVEKPGGVVVSGREKIVALASRAG